MNANKLIELLDKNSGDGNTPLRKAVTLLQQQQAEIEALKAKTLTDEEIIEIGNAVTNLIDSNEGWIEFARAILRKAQE